jgi:hypothetical protein
MELLGGRLTELLDRSHPGMEEEPTVLTANAGYLGEVGQRQNFLAWPSAYNCSELLWVEVY